jgi:hypothetical protein
LLKVVATIALRVWLPDRPGALGEVAGRIGSVGGDVIGIEILERGDGVVVDELIVELPAGVSMRLLSGALAEVGNLTIEDIRFTDGPRDTLARALGYTQRFVNATSQKEVLDSLVGYAHHEMRADWAAVVPDGGERFISAAGAVPPVRWAVRFAQGVSNRPQAENARSPGLDTASLPVWPVPGSLVVHRARHPLLSAELNQLDLLVDIAASCYHHLDTPRAQHSLAD